MSENEEGRESVSHGALLGVWARERRLAMGLTQEEVIGRMGPDVPENYITNLETGQRKRMIGQPRLGQLVRALGSTESEALQAAGLFTGNAIAEATPSYDASSPEDALRWVYSDLSEESIQSIKGFAAYLQDQERRDQRTQRRVEREAG